MMGVFRWFQGVKLSNFDRADCSLLSQFPRPLSHIRNPFRAACSLSLSTNLSPSFSDSQLRQLRVTSPCRGDCFSFSTFELVRANVHVLSPISCRHGFSHCLKLPTPQSLRKGLPSFSTWFTPCRKLCSFLCLSNGSLHLLRIPTALFTLTPFAHLSQSLITSCTRYILQALSKRAVAIFSGPDTFSKPGQGLKP